MDFRVDRELTKLHSNNFQRAQDIKESFSSLLMNQSLTPAEIGLCSSKLFTSDSNIFVFLEKYVGQKDNLMAETRKALYKIIAEYIKVRKDYVQEYLEAIYVKCMILFKREDSNKCKESSLWPIVSMLKNSEQLDFIKAIQLSRQLVDELKFCKPVATVKGKIWHLFGLLIKKFNSQFSTEEGLEIKQELQEYCLNSLKEQVSNQKTPEQVFIQGALKFFRFSLQFNTLTAQQIDSLFTCMKVCMTPIKDISNYKIVNASIKAFKQNLQIFNANLLIGTEVFFSLLIQLISHQNRDVKENASELLEKFIDSLAEKLEEDQNRHKRVFNVIMDKFCEILNAEDKDLFLLTVVIRSVGVFAKAIVKIRGMNQLITFFHQLIELSQSRVLRVFEKQLLENENEEEIKKGASFKAVLYRQKQLNSFLISYSNLIRNLDQISEQQVQHLFNVCIIAVKQHFRFFDKYRPYLYEALVNMIVSFQYHKAYSQIFIEKLISDGLQEGLDLGGNQTELVYYYETAKQVANLWSGLIVQKELWTQHTLQIFCETFLKQINLILIRTDFTYKLRNLQEDEVQTLLGQVKEQILAPNKPQDLLNFHRMVLVLSYVLPKVPVFTCKNTILFLLRSACSRIRKNNKAILLLLFTRVILNYIREKQLLSDNNGEINQKLKVQISSEIQKLIHFLYPLLKVYQGELLEECLNLLLSVPTEIIRGQNYNLLRTIYLDIFPKGFQCGAQCLPLAFTAVQQLAQIIQQQKLDIRFKQLLRLLRDVVPCLSGYLQVEQKGDSNYLDIFFDRLISGSIDPSLNKKSYSLDGLYLDQFTQIDKIFPFRRLLTETSYSMGKLVQQVKQLLGSMGGEAHMIVHDVELQLAWDYECPITFPLPLGAKKYDISLGQFLPRVLELCCSEQGGPAQQQSGKLIHALTLFMIGKSATAGQGGAQKAKEEFAILYRRLFPGMLRVAAGTYGAHPCKQDFSTLMMQLARWFANTRQYESPDVSQLLDALMEEPCKQEDLSLELFCSQVIGEFIKWTIKQTTSIQLKDNYANIKTIMRRVQTYLGHPDIRKKKLGLLVICEFLQHTKNEQFLVEKYYIEITSLLKLASEAGDSTIYLQRASESLIQSLSKFQAVLYKETDVKKSGGFKNLQELLEWLIEETLKCQDTPWEVIALEIWDGVLRKGEQSGQQQTFLIELSKKHRSKQTEKYLFSKTQFKHIEFKIESAETTLHQIRQLITQCRVWSFLFNQKIFKPKDFFIFIDFTQITISNISNMFQFYSNRKQSQLDKLRGYEESPLYDILSSLTQEPIIGLSLSQNYQGQLDSNDQNVQQNIASAMASAQLEQFVSSQLKLIDQVYTLITFDEGENFAKILDMSFKGQSQKEIINVTCGLILRPTYYVEGLSNQLDSQINIVESLIKKSKVILPHMVRVFRLKNFFLQYLIPVLQEILEGKFKFKLTNLEEVLLNNEVLKDNTEFRLFISGLKFLLSNFTEFDESQEPQKFLENFVSRLVEMIRAKEEKVDDKAQEMFLRDKHNEIDAEKTNMFLDFCFQSDSEKLDKFCISILESSGIFKQKYESLLVGYVSRRWEVVGKDFLKISSTKINLFKYLIMIVNSLPDLLLQSFIENIQLLRPDRSLDMFLLIEIKFNSVILSRLSENKILLPKYKIYLEELAQRCAQNQNSLEIHREVLVLLGLLIKLRDKIERDSLEFDRYLEVLVKDVLAPQIRNKYFPLKVRELVKGSLHETNFRAILRSFSDAIRLTGRIEMLQLLFPYIREDLDQSNAQELEKMIKGFIVENYQLEDSVVDLQAINRQTKQLCYIMDKVIDPQLDMTPTENLRVALANKVLKLMLKNTHKQALIDFYLLYGKNILDEVVGVGIQGKPQPFPEQWSACVLQIQIQCVYMDLIELMYQLNDSDRVKNDIRKKIYGANSQDSEIQKKIIPFCARLSRYRFEKLHVLEAAAKQVEHSNFDYKSLVQEYYCSAYNLLAQTLLSTQTKENLFNSQLFQVRHDKGELLFEQLTGAMQTDFQVEVQFKEENAISFKRLVNKGTNKLKDQIVQKYHESVTLGTLGPANFQSTLESEEVQQEQSIIEEEAPQQIILQEEERLEMDQVNQHKCMVPLLRVIDFLHSRFPGKPEEMPQWMTWLYNEAIDKDCKLNVLIYIIKIVLNRSKVFDPYASSWMDVLVKYAMKETKPNGGKGFHYFLRDTVMQIIQWSQDAKILKKYIEVTPAHRQRLSSVVNNIIRFTAHKEKRLFKQNLEIFDLLLGNWKDYIFLEEGDLTKMLKCTEESKKQDYYLWQLNGLAALKCAVVHNVPILPDYQELVRTQHLQNLEKYRYILGINERKGGGVIPLDFLCEQSVIPTLKKEIFKQIASAFGHILASIDKYHRVDRNIISVYENEIKEIIQRLLADTRPGYARDRFTLWTRVLAQIYPKILNTSEIFMKCSDMIVLSSANERQNILQVFLSFLSGIEQNSNNISKHLSDISLTLHGSSDRILNEPDPGFQLVFLRIMELLASTKLIRFSQNHILGCFLNYLPKMHEIFSRFPNQEHAKLYLSLLQKLHEYLILDSEEDSKKLKDQVQSSLLDLFTSPHGDIRRAVFSYFEKDRERRSSNEIMDRVINLLNDTYNPERENMWLRSAVPLLLSLCKRTSDYDRLLFENPLEQNAQYYDIEFRSSKYFQKVNLSQQRMMLTQSQSILTQALGMVGGVRSTQDMMMEEERINQSIQPSQYPSLQQDDEGFYKPQSRRQENMSQFFRSNELTSDQVRLTSGNRLRYIVTDQSEQRLTQQTIFRQRKQAALQPLIPTERRAYRVYELPDIKIPWKQIIDPIMELTFEDEELAGVMLTVLFEFLYLDTGNMQKRLQKLLMDLLRKTRKNSLVLVSTVIRTLHTISVKSQTVFSDSDTIKEVGLDSFSFFQSLMMMEEALLLLNQDDVKFEGEIIEENDNIIIGQRQHGRGKNDKQEQCNFIHFNYTKVKQQYKNIYLMNMIDIHQRLGNTEQVQALLQKQVCCEKIIDKITQALNHKLEGINNQAKEEFEALLPQQDERINKFIYVELDDALAKLGQWDQMDTQLTDRIEKNEPLERFSLEELKRVSNKYLRSYNEDKTQDYASKLKQLFNRLSSKNETRSVTTRELAFQHAMSYLINGDFDQVRYFLQQSDLYFIDRWAQLSQGNNSILSKELKHKHLELLQRNFELGEFVQLGEFKLEELFAAWNTRAPSVIYDSLEAWEALLQCRMTMTNVILDTFDLPESTGNRQLIFSVLQNAKGLLKKGLYDQALTRVSQVYELKEGRKEFDWEFNKITARVKMLILENQSENQEKSQILKELYQQRRMPQVDKQLQEHKKLYQVFEEQYFKNKDSIKELHLGIKIQNLFIQCLENFVYIYQDLLFQMTQFQIQSDNYSNQFDPFFTTYSKVVKDIFNAYSRTNKHIIQVEKNVEKNSINDFLLAQKKFYQRAAKFYEQTLRMLEISKDLNIKLRSQEVQLEQVAQLFFDYTVKSFEIAQRVSSNPIYAESIVIRLIKVVTKFCRYIGPQFQESIKKGTLPTWLFLPYLPQLMYLINLEEECKYFNNLFVKLAHAFPETFLYQFNVIYENFEDCKSALAKYLYTYFRKTIPRNFEFMAALNSLTHPEHRLLYFIDQLFEKINQQTHPNQNELQSLINYIRNDCLIDTKNKRLGDYNKNFILAIKPKFEDIVKNLKSIDNQKLKNLQDLVKSREGQNKIKFNKLSDLSKWFSNFNLLNQDDDIEEKIEMESDEELDAILTNKPQEKRDFIIVPGQFQERNFFIEKDESLAVKIASFDEGLLVMSSIRKPKRLTIYGTDEKTYRLLVKGVEDLRLDQRIEQIFKVMNSLLEGQNNQTELKISTFSVVPMTKSLGVLEWVDNTKPLREILEYELKLYQQGVDLGSNNKAVEIRKQFLSQECKRQGKDIPESLPNFIAKRHILLLSAPSERIIQHYESQEKEIPDGLLRDALKRMSQNLESFMFIRDRFLRNYSLVCLSGYILGIGDRHLENFLLNTRSGEVISIDFGYSFGQAISLMIPELMPFRLSKVFEYAAAPIGLKGIFRHSMINVLKCFRQKRHTLLDFCEVFINDPLLDQVKIARDRNIVQSIMNQMARQIQFENEIIQQSSINQQSVQRSSIQSSIQSSESSQPMVISSINQSLSIRQFTDEQLLVVKRKIDIMRKKLMGIHCSQIMIEELKDSQHRKKEFFDNIRQVIEGRGSRNAPARFRFSKLNESQFAINLSVVDQTDCLIDQATDPNILGRTWVGWSPYV